MAQGEAILFWIAVGVYTASSLGFLSGVIFGRRRWLGYATAAAGGGFLIQSTAIILRWVVTGHAPIVGDYENAQAASWLVILIFLGAQYRYVNLRALGVAVIPFCLLMLGYGVMRSPALEPLTPPFRSNWLYVHIAFAWFAYSSYVVAAGLAVLFLLRSRRQTLANEGSLARLLPSLPVLDELGYRFIAFGFVADAAMLVAGAIWANSLWGSYWSWDPVQTWSLISWLIYGLYLHLRVIHGWRLKRAAWLAIAALIAVVVSFWATNYLTLGLHVF